MLCEAPCCSVVLSLSLACPFRCQCWNKVHVFPSIMVYTHVSMVYPLTRPCLSPTEVQCPRPDIPNAKRVAGGSGPYGYKDTLTYECNKGFEMVSGEARIVCMENGWSVMPKCEGKPSVNVQPVLHILEVCLFACVIPNLAWIMPQLVCCYTLLDSNTHSSLSFLRLCLNLAFIR